MGRFSLALIAKSFISESRLPQRILRDMETAAKMARRKGAEIEINERMPYISIKQADGEEYFFRDSEAEDLLDEVPDNISPEDYILAVSQGW